MKRLIRIVVFFGALTAIWWLAVASGRWSSVILPSPLSVAEYLWNSIFDGTLLEATESPEERKAVKVSFS